jgi:hypothetical protein
MILIEIDQIFGLPGTTDPEAHVFTQVADRIDAVAGRLALSMQLPFDQQDRVKQVIKERGLTNRDKHVIWQQIGESLDFTSSFTVETAFLSVWAQEHPDEVKVMLDQFRDLIPRR